MIKAVISDFSYVLLFPRDKSFNGGLNPLHKELSQKSDYNALDYFELNTDLLDFYVSLKQKVCVHIFTSDIIQDAPEFQPFIQPVFDRIFSASKMGVSKTDPEAYRKVANELDLEPSTILFTDDLPGNIQAAHEAGFITVQYLNNEQLFEEVKRNR